MSEKRFEVLSERMIFDNETEQAFGLFMFSNDAKKVVDLLNFQNTQIKILKEENEQLRTQLQICQQSTNDGRFQVWEVPPIPKGMRIISFTTSNGEEL